MSAIQSKNCKMVVKKFKTRDELEEEDHQRYLQHQEDTWRRRRAKLAAEGFKCTFDGCDQTFSSKEERFEHLGVHNKECRDKMICNQPNCGKKVCVRVLDLYIHTYYDNDRIILIIFSLIIGSCS